MFGSICKRLFVNLEFEGCSSYKHVSSTRLYSFSKPFSSSSSSSSSSLLLAGNESVSVAAGGDEEHSFTVSYLISSCGLSPEKALATSKKVHFNTSLKPDKVLSLLKSNGFTSAHITKFVATCPRLLLADAEKNLGPKLNFLRSIGVPKVAIGRITASSPWLFTNSLAARIVPNYNALKRIVGSDEMAVKAFRHDSWILRVAMNTNFDLNVKLLRELGVPESSIVLMITNYSRCTLHPHTKFKEIVDWLIEMGFDLRKSTFVKAICVTCVIGISNLGRKFEVYSRWGWSKEDATSAFKSQPHCMCLSEKRVLRGMDFFVTKVGCSSKLIARHPIIFCFSLEKRTIPRISVVQVLLHNGLIKEDFKLTRVLKYSDKDFLQKYVIKFQEQVPQLRDVYGGKVDITDLGTDFHDSKLRSIWFNKVC